jgi:hypothetical protein
LGLHGLGALSAAQLLLSFSHTGRSAAKQPSPCCQAPRAPVSSGRTGWHRLNRQGDRQLNRALHQIVVSRMGYPDYVVLIVPVTDPLSGFITLRE